MRHFVKLFISIEIYLINWKVKIFTVNYFNKRPVFLHYSDSTPRDIQEILCS